MSRLSGFLAPALLAAALLLAVSTWLSWRPAGTAAIAADLAACAAVLGVALLLGLGLLRRSARAAVFSPVARLVQGLALGAGTLALLVVLLGLGGALSRRGVLLVLAVAALAGLLEPRRLRGELAAAAAELRAVLASPLRAATATVLLFALCLPVLPALLPAAFYDALLYHLEAPALWLASGRLDAQPYNFHLNYPLNLSALYLAAEALHPGASVALVHCGFLAAAALALLALGAEMTPGTGVLAALIFAASPAVIETASYPIADLAVVFWVLAAVIAWLRFSETGGAALLVLAGFHLGFAAGAKYTALMVGYFPIALLTLAAGRARPFGRRLADSTLLAAALLVAMSPWLLRNGIETGNPVYPYFFAAREPFAAGHSFTAEVKQRLPGDAGAGSFLANALAGPADLLTGGAGVAPYLGLALFLPLPFLLLRRKHPPSLTALLLLGGAGLLVWALTVHVTRYALPAVALLTVPAAAALRLGAGTRWGRALAVVVAITLAQDLFLGVVALDWGSVRDVLRGMETRGQYLRRTVSYYDVAQWANAHLAASDRILFVGEARGFYCRVPHTTVGTTRPTLLLEAARAAPGKPIGETLRQRGYTHVLVSWPEIRRIHAEQPDYLGRTPAEAEALREFLAAGVERLHGDDEVYLARIVEER